MRSAASFLLFSLLALFLSGCEGKDEPIPAYLRIDSLALLTSAGQGSQVHEISTLHVYANGNYLGQFEIPCSVPVLAEGPCEFIMIPAARLNGSRNQYAILRNLQSFDTTISLKPGQVSSAGTPSFRFKSNTEFMWVEDFEDNNSSLIELFSSPGDTSYITTEPFRLNGNFAGNTKCMKVVMSPADTAKIIDMASFRYFSNFPTDGSDVMLEFDVKSPLPVQVALIIKNSSGRNYRPYVYIVPTEGKWKRFYINLYYELYNQPPGTEAQLLFSPQKVAGIQGTQEIFFDNIRVSHLK